MTDQKQQTSYMPGLKYGWAALRGTGPALILGLCLLGVLFHNEATTAVYTWIDSTAYNHCFLVIPIVAYLIWDRRAGLRGYTAQPLPAAALAGLPLAILWIAVERMGIMEGRQLVAVGFLQVLFLGVLGWRLWWAVSGPLMYLFFAVPFGEFLTPVLQDITTVFVRHGLDIVGIKAYIDGYVIEIPEGTFFIAQACAGLRFLIAAIAFGGLYALLMYRSPVRRVVFMVISVVVPIVANGFRALGIVSLGHILGSAEAAAADHIIYGWIFFSFVILLLLLCGLPFRVYLLPEPARAAAAPVSGPLPRMAVVWAGAPLLLIALIGPAAATFMNQSAEDSAPRPAAFTVESPCRSEPGTPPVRLRASRGGRSADQRVTCDYLSFDIHVAAFSPRSTAGPVLAERRRLIHPPDIEEIDERWLDDTAHDWRVITGTEQPFVMAIGVWIGGEPARLGLKGRAHMAWTSIAGGGHVPVIVTVSPVIDWTKVPRAARPQVEAALAEFLRERIQFPAQIQAIRPNAR